MSPIGFNSAGVHPTYGTATSPQGQQTGDKLTEAERTAAINTAVQQSQITSQAKPSQEEMIRAVQVLQERFAGTAGEQLLTPQALSDLAFSESTPADVRKAALFMIAHPDVRSMLAGHGDLSKQDGEITEDDLKESLFRLGKGTFRLNNNGNSLSDDEARAMKTTQVLLEHMKGTGTTQNLTPKLLNDWATGQNVPLSVKTAAKDLQQNPALRRLIDGSGNSRRADGIINSNDLREALKALTDDKGITAGASLAGKNNGRISNAPDAALVLLEYLQSNKKKNLSVEELRTLADHPDTSPELRSAARFYLDREHDRARLTGGGFESKADGIITQSDLKKEFNT